METQRIACAQIHLEIENEAIKEYQFFILNTSVQWMTTFRIWGYMHCFKRGQRRFQYY